LAASKNRMMPNQGPGHVPFSIIILCPPGEFADVIVYIAANFPTSCLLSFRPFMIIVFDLVLITGVSFLGRQSDGIDVAFSPSCLLPRMGRHAARHERARVTNVDMSTPFHGHNFQGISRSTSCCHLHEPSPIPSPSTVGDHPISQGLELLHMALLRMLMMPLYTVKKQTLMRNGRRVRHKYDNLCLGDNFPSTLFLWCFPSPASVP
jgi:hypothetical protein